jgi:hypothetical protein
MESITFQCYSCHQILKVSADKAGRKAKCVKCETVLTIPATSTPGLEASYSTPDLPSASPQPRPPQDEIVDIPVSRPRAPAPRAERDAEDEDRPRRRSRDEDYEERPRRSRADDYDDRPRRSRDRDRDRDEDDDDRPRRGRGRDRDRDDEEEDDDRIRRRKGGGKMASWPKVRVGLLLNAIAAGMQIGVAGMGLLWLLFWFVGFLANSEGMGKAGIIFAQITMYLWCLLQIPAVVGYVFSLFAPNKNGSLGLAITTLAIGGVALIFKLWMLVNLINAGSGGVGGPGAGGGGGMGVGPMGMMPMMSPSQAKVAAIILLILYCLLFYSEWVIFSLYLRAVALTVKERWLAGGCLGLMGLACGVGGVNILLWILILSILNVTSPSPGNIKVVFWIGEITGIIWFGMMLGFAIWYMRTILQMRNSVG